MRAGALIVGILAGAAASGRVMDAGQQGIGQTPSGLPLSQTIRERGSSVTGAYEGWFYGRDGNTYAMVGYFNRNNKQELEIPIGRNNRNEAGGPEEGQANHLLTGRAQGVI